MVYVRYRYGIDQEQINAVLRPHKQRFPRGKIPGAQTRMKEYGRKRLSTYKPQLEYRYLSNLKNSFYKFTQTIL